jgi:Ca2+-binding EF-hand superfamily protein
MSGRGTQQAGKATTSSGKVTTTVNVKDKLDTLELKELKDIFELFDEDGSGTIDPSEVTQILSHLGLDKRNPIVFQMIEDMKSRTKAITFDDFLGIVVSKLGDVRTREGLTKLFSVYDNDDSGVIDFEKFKNVAREIGENLNDDQILEMMHHVHVLNKTESNEGINFEEFYRVVTKKRY